MPGCPCDRRALCVLAPVPVPAPRHASLLRNPARKSPASILRPAPPFPRNPAPQRKQFSRQSGSTAAIQEAAECRAVSPKHSPGMPSKATAFLKTTRILASHLSAALIFSPHIAKRTYVLLYAARFVLVQRYALPYVLRFMLVRKYELLPVLRFMLVRKYDLAYVF